MTKPRKNISSATGVKTANAKTLKMTDPPGSNKSVGSSGGISKSHPTAVTAIVYSWANPRLPTMAHTAYTAVMA